MEESNKSLEISLREKYPEILDKKLVQEILMISAASLNRMIASSSIEYIKLSDSPKSPVRFELSSIIKLIESRRVRSYHMDGTK
jgi:hypothetical protein